MTGGASSTSQHVIGTPQEKLEEPEHSSSNWYFSREYIEKASPSRRDGIDLKKEAYFRKSYCTFLQDLGMRLKVPQVTIATAIVFCHRFFLRQSHAKNDRYVIATTCMFLACKVEESPQKLSDVIYLSYEIRNKKDPNALQKIKQKELYEPQKELVLLGECLVLTTLGFDLIVYHPYKPLVAAIKKFKVAQNTLAQVAWNFVNDGLRTSLCLQFKPHHLAAGAIFLAAKFLKVKLPNEGEKVWWQEFDVTPRQLEEVSNQMLELYEQNRDAPASRTSGPSATASACNQNGTAAGERSFSTAHASERALTAEGQMKDNDQEIGSARHSVGWSKDPNASEKGLNQVGQVNNESALSKEISGEKWEEAEEERKMDGSSFQAASDLCEGKVGSGPSPLVGSGPLPQVMEAVSNENLKNSRIDICDGGGDSKSKSVLVDKERKGNEGVGLDEVNIDRVKAALKRRKSRGQDGEVKPPARRPELTDEELLLEGELEDRRTAQQHKDNNRQKYSSGSQGRSVFDGTQTCSRLAIHDQKLFDVEVQDVRSQLRKDSVGHLPKFEADMHFKDKELLEKDLKRPRLSQGQ